MKIFSQTIRLTIIHLPFWDDFSKNKIDDNNWSFYDDISLRNYNNNNAPSLNVIELDGLDKR